MNVNDDSRLLARLEGLRKTSNGYVALCPAHDDRNPSLSLSWVEDRFLIHCFAGCSVESIVRSIGLTLSDLFVGNDSAYNPRHGATENSPTLQRQSINPKPRRIKIRNRRQTAVYEFHDELGRVIAVKRRYDFEAVYDDGSIRPSKEFTVAPAGLPLPLYRLPSVLAAIRNSWHVYLAEGEAKADLIETYLREEWGSNGAATSYGGHWRTGLASALHGAHVVIVPDIDDAGAHTAKRVIRDLRGIASTIALCDITDLLTALPIEEGGR